MPIGPFGEIIGTTGTLENVGEKAQKYKSKVIAPRNPKLVKGEHEKFKIKPSQFMFQMSMDTEKKLANMHTMNVPKKVELLDMSETSHQKVSNVNIDEPMFQPFPSEIFFQNFEPFETYEVPLVLRNNDKVPRLVKVTQETSPYFKIISPHNVGHKVGPGLPTTFRLQFTPEEKKDYNHALVCITEREKFIVPVRAIGARAILDFPDEVNFQPSPVKYTSSRTLLIRNIGNKDAKFTLECEKPFSVSPENGVLPMGESMQVTVEFKPTTVGDHSKDLVLHYDTGEDIYISLYGAAQDAHVRLDKNSIRVENTFISMANQRTVTISNRSDVIAHFSFTLFATQEEEEQQKMMFCGSLNKEETTERDRFLEECIADPTLRDKLSILSRTFQNRKRLVEGDKMLFDDDVFSIEPAEGDIWPNSTTEISIIFKPTEAKTYQCTAFCDVTGRETRLPLRIRGDGIGPKVQFSFDELDMGNIFVNSTHTYEVVLANKGDIDAIFSLIPSNTVFGPKFVFNPSEGIVMPGGHQAIQVTFRSHILGDFKEDFYIQIDGSPEKLKLSFTGSVIGPTFQFDVPKLKFGTISYGFVNTQMCTLMNTALVPMTYTLRVPSDGVGDSITSRSEYNSGMSEAGSNLPPREFEITPSQGTIPPQSEVKVKVDFCSNSIKKYDLAMVVDVAGVGEEVLSLPISAKCVVPPVSVLTQILDYGRCFLRHPYEHNVKLQNVTELPAKYELVPQYVDENTEILYTSPKPKGIIAPQSVTDVPLVITPQGLEELEVVAQFKIFGSPEPPLPVNLTCIGEGPVVHIMPLDLDWGQLPVLTDTSKIIRLSNESLIPAKFTAHMVRPNSVWRVEPSSGEIPPEEQLELTVTACLDDSVRFYDKVQINICDGPSRTIPVTAYGFGTSIVTDPPMSPTLNLGPHFSKGPCKRKFLLTNRGRRHQSLVWSTEGFSFMNKPKKPGTLNPIKTKDMKYKDMPPVPDQPKPIFRLTPHRMELNPGESIEVELEGMVDTPQVVREKMVCHAIIGRAGGKELIMKVAISCEFITPLLEFSTDQVAFRVDKRPEDDLDVRTEELELTNVSSLPLTTVLSLNYPFQLLMEEEGVVSEAEVTLGIGETRKLQIQFDPAYKDDRHSRTIEDVLIVAYKEHPHVDKINLKGEVYFPNLEFEKNIVDFGCILNDTEVTRYINITNNSPTEVNYKWSFLIDDTPVVTYLNRPVVATETPMEVEDIEDNVTPEEPEVEMRVEVTIEGAESPRSEDSELDKMEADEITEKEAMLLGQSDGEEKKDPEKDHVEFVPDQPDVPTIQTSQPLSEIQEDEAVDTDVEQDIVIDGEEQGHDVTFQDDRPPSCLGTPKPTPPINPTLALLLEKDRQQTPLGVEEIFDILPLYGTLKPGETEQVTLTFFGHAHIGSKAKAICEVEGGPTYEVILKGEASLVEYKFDCLDIDYGKQMFDQVAEAEIVLVNTGLVGFEFTALGMDPAMATRPKPGVPVMIPHTGFIEANSEQVLTVKFLPGIPEKFHKNFQIQVAHFEPDTVNLFGEGVFPRISLDLQRINDEEGHYEALLKQAREVLSQEMKERKRNVSDVIGGETQREDEQFSLQLHGDAQPSELEVQMEAERLVVQEFALEMAMADSQPDILEVHTDSQHEQAFTRESKKSRKKSKQRPKLPHYLLDFGHVVLGTVRTHIVRATNTGWCPVSFNVSRDQAAQMGFNVELDRVKQLPGAPDHETVDFVVSFDPRGANLNLGEVESVIPLNIVGGPQVCIRVKANVTMPDMQISTDVLDFTEVKCGECKVITVQLHNHKHVRCEWNSLPTEKDKKKLDKHIPMHLRRKARQAERMRPRTFEMMPATGSLMPGQRVNVQVKFMPTEEKFYEQRIAIRLSQSSQRIMLLCRGQGLEPHVEFEQNLVEFGPVLPHSAGDEQDIIIKNPCSFPIEIYNLEFDKAFLDEEKILRLMKGYDEYNTILLPPRGPGEKLPQELLDFFEEQLKKLEEAERARREAEEARREQEEREAAEKAEGSEESKDKEGSTEDDASKADNNGVPLLTTTAPSRAQDEETDADKTADLTSGEKKDEDSKEDDKAKDTSSSVGVGELEITPVSAAIARHLGIDLSAEGKAARNRRGIAIIVNGPPLSGKSATSIALAKRYQAALLSIDGVVREAIANGNTPAGLKARELCAEAARRRAEELKLLEGEDPEKVKAMGGLSVEALNAHTQGQVAVAQSMAHSVVSNRKTSTVVTSDQKSKLDKGGKNAFAAGGSSGEAASQSKSIHHPSTLHVKDPSEELKRARSPPPLAAPIARRLSISASITGEEGLMSTVLPEEVLVEILAERLMLNDCHRGVVFDGLETLFSQNMFTAARSILKAFNNRKYIYMVTLKLDYNVLKEQEKKAQEEKERLAKEQEEEERRRLEEMSEDEYDALGEEEKADVDRKRLEIKKERLRREMEEKRLERERREREAAEAELRRQEEEKASKKKRRGQDGKDTKDPKDGKKSQGTGKTTDSKSQDRMGVLKSQEGKKAHSDSDHGVNKSVAGMERPDSHMTERGESAEADGRKKKKVPTATLR